jgi:hypothetical protein
VIARLRRLKIISSALALPLASPSASPFGFAQVVGSTVRFAEELLDLGFHGQCLSSGVAQRLERASISNSPPPAMTRTPGSSLGLVMTPAAIGAKRGTLQDAAVRRGIGARRRARSSRSQRKRVPASDQGW